MDEKNTQNNNDIGPEEKDDLEKIKKERDEYLDGWQRAKADFVNYKKEEMKRFEMFARVANEELVRELIIILDSFDLAIMALEKEGKDENNSAKLTMQGVYLIKNQLMDTLKKFGLEKIKTKVGEQFDPSKHEAISVAESDQPSNTIIEEIESGYILNGKLVRPARVKVVK